MNFKYLTAGVAAAALFISAGSAYAFWGIGQSPVKDGLVSAIAQKFNLNQAEVQKVFDEKIAEQKAQMQKENQEKCSERMEKAVLQGKLTQEQADKIEAKKKELQTQRTSLEGKSLEEIKDIMQAQKDSLKKWAEENNIPLQYMPGAFGKGAGSCGMIKKGGGFGKLFKDSSED